jgi:hypothetical protein
MTCPECNREVIEGKSTCPFCGLIFAKWKSPTARNTKERLAYMAQPVAVAEPDPKTTAERIRMPAFLIGIGAALAAVLIVALGIRYFISGVGTAVQQKGLAKGSPSSQPAGGTRRALVDTRSDFDLSLDAGADPLGLVWGNDEFVVGNRTSPWGFVRFRPLSDTDFGAAQSVPVYDSTSSQQVAFWTVAWNGKHYIAYSDGAFLDKNYRNTFSVHDPKTLAVKDYFPAPELIGGLTWDGSGYWAATRRTTGDSREPAFLYRLDQHFNVLGRYDPPATGCQGLAWDGTNLWWADVFSDNLYIIKVDGAKPETLHTYHTNLDYLSGIAFDGSNIWIVEYRQKEMRRLNPKLREMWSAGNYRIASYDQAIAALELANADTAGSAESKDELLRVVREDPAHCRAAFDKLERLGARDQAIALLQDVVRSPDEKLRAQAKDALRQIGVLPTYDCYVNNYSRTSEDADAIETSAELVGDKLRVSWRLYFGSQIFANTSSPPLAKYRVVVKGAGLGSPLTKEFDARPGDNVKTNEEIATNLGSGRYTVEFEIVAQFVDGSGTRKVLNRSVPPLEVGK